MEWAEDQRRSPPQRTAREEGDTERRVSESPDPARGARRAEPSKRRALLEVAADDQVALLLGDVERAELEHGALRQPWDQGAEVDLG